MSQAILTLFKEDFIDGFPCGGSLTHFIENGVNIILPSIDQLTKSLISTVQNPYLIEIGYGDEVRFKIKVIALEKDIDDDMNYSNEKISGKIYFNKSIFPFLKISSDNISLFSK